MKQPNRWTTPLRLLVEPARAWNDLAVAPSALPAFLYHVITIIATWLINAQLYSEVVVAAGIGSSKTMTGLTLVEVTLQSLISVAVTALLLALALWVVTRLVAASASFRHSWALALNGSLPLAVGWLYGSLLFFFVKPLSIDLLTAISLLLKPYSLGLITFMPGHFAALSLPWFFATYFDLFGIWSIILVIIGMARFLGVERSKLAWAVLSLMLLLALIITGLWQVIQLGITSAL